MKKLSILLVLGAAVLLTQCAKKTSAPTKEVTSIEKVAAIKRSYSTAQLEQGMTIFRANCNKCHKYYEPETIDVARWEKVLPPMSAKAHLSDDDAAKVRAWVLVHAKMS